MEKRDIVKDRIELLKAMDTYIRNHASERKFMSWITLAVPDEANEYDYQDMAEDDDMFNESAELFGRLLMRK